jgi:monoamine oxidase
MNNRCEIAIIGAGLAGLAAADYLHSEGYKVKVLEAEDRIGGRTYTCHLSHGVNFEQGALSFGNGEQPLWDYIQRFALPLIEQTPIERMIWFKEWKGKISDKASFLKGEEKEIPLNQLWEYFLPKLEALKQEMSLFDAMQLIGASQEAIDYLQAHTLAGMIGNGFQTISTEAVLTFLKQYSHSTSFYALQGGNDQFPQALAKEIKGHILFNYRVKRIEHLKEKCILSGENFTLEAQKVIFAIPLPELKNIEIAPPLSEEKQNAIRNTYYTICARLSMIAPPAILNAVPRGGVFLSSDRLGWFREQTIFQPGPQKKTVLSVSLVGDQAKKLSEFSAIEAWKQAINGALSKLYPCWDPEQVKYYIHFWREGYSYFSSQMQIQQEILRRSEGNLHFAGEHTGPSFASMNAALATGIRAAQEILMNGKTQETVGQSSALATPTLSLQEEMIKTSSSFHVCMDEMRKNMEMLVQQNISLHKQLTLFLLHYKESEKIYEEEKQTLEALIENLEQQLKETNNRLLNVKCAQDSLQEKLKTVNRSKIKMLYIQQSELSSQIRQLDLLHQSGIHAKSQEIASFKQKISDSIDQLSVLTHQLQNTVWQEFKNLIDTFSAHSPSVPGLTLI